MTVPTADTLIRIADQFLANSEGLREVTLSYRVFDDTKKLAALRGGADITLGRFNAAMFWFAANWPEGQELPQALRPFLPVQPAGDARDVA